MESNENGPVSRSCMRHLPLPLLGGRRSCRRSRPFKVIADYPSMLAGLVCNATEQMTRTLATIIGVPEREVIALGGVEKPPPPPPFALNQDNAHLPDSPPHPSMLTRALSCEKAEEAAQGRRGEGNVAVVSQSKDPTSQLHPPV